MSISADHALRLIRKVMQNHPELGANGFGTHDPGRHRWIPSTANPSKFAEDRTAMLSPHSIEAFQTCCDWLQKVEKTKHPNDRVGSSYTLKHRVEEFYKDQHVYVPNGLFIAAAIASGFMLKRLPNSPNAYINVTASSVRSLQDREKKIPRDHFALDHTHPSTKAAVKKVEQTIRALEGHNHALTKQSKGARRNLDKLRRGLEALKGRSISFNLFNTLLYGPLVWFAAKFADEVVGELAKGTLVALRKMVGI